MKKFTIAVLILIGAVAALFGLYFLGSILYTAFVSRLEFTQIYYSAKQIEILKDIAGVLIPTVAGFAVLAVSGVGFLHSSDHMHSKKIQFSVFMVFVLVILSLAGWIYMLGYLVNCSLAFDRVPDPTMTLKFTPEYLQYLYYQWLWAVTCTKLACIAFFLALDIALVTAISVFSDARVNAPRQG